MWSLLLLCLPGAAAPASAPESFLILQEQEPTPQGEPFLQWDGETEDAYRRALHLWKVRGKPSDAADILLGLADTPSVTQRPGQASWVLVLAAQCLAEAGRNDEAAALIPGIERGARDTELDSFVTRELKALSALNGVSESELDQAFLNSLIDVLESQNGEYIKGFMTQFGRAIVPYLMKALELWQEGSVPKNVGIFSFRYSLFYADSATVEALIRFSDQLTSLSFLTIVSHDNSYSDEAAGVAAWRFWEHCADSSDPNRARVGRNAIVSYARYNRGRALDLLTNRLLRGDSELENLWLQRMKGVMDYPEIIPWIERAYQRGGEDRLLAIQHYCQSGMIAELLLLADGGDQDAAVLALAAMAMVQLPNTVLRNQVGRSSGNGVHARIMEAVDAMTGRNWGTQNWSGGMRHAGLPEQGWDSALRLVQDMGHGGAQKQLLLSLAALGLGDEKALQSALVDLPKDVQPVVIQVVRQAGLHEIFPDDAAWAWSSECVISSEREHYDSELADLLRDNSAKASVVQVLGRVDLLVKTKNLRRVLSTWRQNGRDDDLIAFASDPSLNGDSWREVLAAFHRGIEGTDPRILPMLIDQLESGRLSLADSKTRPYIDDYLIGLVERTVDPFSNVDNIQVRSLMEASFSAGSKNRLVAQIAMTEDQTLARIRQEFCTDRLRAEFLLAMTRNNPQGDLVLSALRHGVPLHEAISGATQSEIFPVGNPQRIEVIRILLSTDVPQQVKTGLIWLGPDLQAYQSLTDVLDPLWSNPVYAATLAFYVGGHRDSDPNLVPRMIQVWSIENLQDRSLLVLALANTVDRRVVPILMNAISDADQKVADAARTGLERLKEIEEQRAFWESWQATGVGGSPEAALLKQVRSPNPEVRLAAIKALGAMRSPNALPLLISLLEDADPAVVAAARLALAWISEPEPVAEPPK